MSLVLQTAIKATKRLCFLHKGKYFSKGETLFTRESTFEKEKLFSQEFFTFTVWVTLLEKVKTLFQLVGLLALFTLFQLLKVPQGPKKGHVILLMHGQPGLFLHGSYHPGTLHEGHPVL